MNTHLHNLRRMELEAVKQQFKPGMRIVEIGAGDGYQASLAESWGCPVTCYDIVVPKEPCHQIIIYDGRRIPEQDASADLVMCMVVLCFFLDDSWMLKEIHRLLKPGAKAVIMMGTVTWRFWTAVAHYVWLCGFLFNKAKSLFNRKSSSAAMASSVNTAAPGAVKKESYFKKAMKLLCPRPLNGNPSVAWELANFREKSVRRVIEAEGLRVVAVAYPGVFYTGYSLLGGRLGLRLRRVLSYICGSSSNIYIVEKI